MNSNDETPVPTASEREAARARLARQIGRLLANEWLRTRAANRPGFQGRADSCVRNRVRRPSQYRGINLGSKLKATHYGSARRGCGNSDNGQSTEEGDLIWSRPIESGLPQPVVRALPCEGSERTGSRGGQEDRFQIIHTKVPSTRAPRGRTFSRGSRCGGGGKMNVAEQPEFVNLPGFTAFEPSWAEFSRRHPRWLRSDSPRAMSSIGSLRPCLACSGRSELDRRDLTAEAHSTGSAFALKPSRLEQSTDSVPLVASNTRPDPPAAD